MDLETFIARWAASGDAERANKDSFLTELCDVLGVARPAPKTGDPARDLCVFAEKLLESLAAVGLAVEMAADGGGGERRWRWLR